jgi:anthranilate/para-aminobenzoate synthase component I
VIARVAAPLAPAEAARRAGAAPGAFWLSAPAGDEARDESAIARDFVGARPVGVVRGAVPADLAELERAWDVARAVWSEGGAARPGVPIAVGWLSYELGRRLVGLPARETDGPLFAFHFHDAVWIREADGEARIHARDTASADALAALLGREVASEPARLGPLEPAHPPATFLDGVRRILDYLQAGDAYQVNLSRRLRATVMPGDPTALAAALGAGAPAPHAAFIAGVSEGAAADALTDSLTILGNSPERFLSLGADGAVETRPIKGTRPRVADADADREIAAELAGAAKDRAEHVMIVDLERNDLGRVCRPGSIEVASLARVVSLPTVHHLVSTVRGRLRPEIGLTALLAATFPGGSVTGAPKRRAMQIIDELEPAPRGIYTGATGWLGAAGDLDLAIAIRTAVLRAGTLEVSVGGGIVADSTPEGELAETEVKARAFAALARSAGQGRSLPRGR